MRRVLFIFIAAFLLLAPASAAGDGPPTARGTAEGVVTPGGADRYSALATSRGTVLARSETDGGRLLFVRVIRGGWIVPTVAYDNTAGGLSADGRTLVLMQPAKRLPRRVSRFTLVGTRLMAPKGRIVLKGDWSFDALSPDGSTLYLTQALDKTASRYAVRAYDVRAHRLLRKPIVDPSEPDEPLRGYPVTRVTGPGGRWEYTLYAGGKETFVHALDTVGRTSICIDLPARLKKAKRIWQFKLQLRGPNIAVVDRGRTVATAARKPEEASTGGGPPWLVVLVAATGLLAAAGVRRTVRSG